MTPTYRYTAPVLRLDTDMRQHYVPVPHDIADALSAAGVRRLVATLNGHPVRRALHRTRDGERFVVLSRSLLRDIGARFGETITVVLQPDPDPDAVDLGEELAAVLEQDEAAAARFASLTPGRQRSLAHYVTSARRAETRISRALELAHKLKTHTLYGDRRRDE